MTVVRTIATDQRTTTNQIQRVTTPTAHHIFSITHKFPPDDTDDDDGGNNQDNYSARMTINRHSSTRRQQRQPTKPTIDNDVTTDSNDDDDEDEDLIHTQQQLLLQEKEQIRQGQQQDGNKDDNRRRFQETAKSIDRVGRRRRGHIYIRTSILSGRLRDQWGLGSSHSRATNHSREEGGGCREYGYFTFCGMTRLALLEFLHGIIEARNW